MECHVIHDPNGPDIELRGEIVVNTTGEDIGAVTIWRSETGTIVVRQVRNALRGREAINRLGVFKELSELATWLGSSPKAKAVLDTLGHDRRRTIL